MDRNQYFEKLESFKIIAKPTLGWKMVYDSGIVIPKKRDFVQGVRNNQYVMIVTKTLT